MKTNQIMKRPMGSFEVLQRTSDGYFDGAALLYQWNSIKSNPERKMSKFFEASETKSFIEVLEEDIKSQSANMPNADNQVFKKIKGRITKSGRTRDQVWMHPYLFIKFSLWINPRFELQVIKFVYDELIKNRHIAGDNYNVLTSALATLADVDYREVANAMNWIVFNRNGKNLRQSATQDELRELSELEHSLAFSINNGLVRNQQHLICLMRNIYNNKYAKF